MVGISQTHLNRAVDRRLVPDVLDSHFQFARELADVGCGMHELGAESIQPQGHGAPAVLYGFDSVVTDEFTGASFADQADAVILDLIGHSILIQIHRDEGESEQERQRQDHEESV